MVGYEDIQYKNCGDSGRYVNVPGCRRRKFSSYTPEITSFCGAGTRICWYKGRKTALFFTRFHYKYLLIKYIQNSITYIF